jgi:hypothetical protein
MAAKLVPRQNVSRAPPEAAADVPDESAAEAAPTVPLFVDPAATLACCAYAALGNAIAIPAVTAIAADKIASVVIVLFIVHQFRERNYLSVLVGCWDEKLLKAFLYSYFSLSFAYVAN